MIRTRKPSIKEGALEKEALDKVLITVGPSNLASKKDH